MRSPHSEARSGDAHGIPTASSASPDSSRTPIIYEEFVALLHGAINSTENPRRTLNFLRAMCGMPAVQPIPPELLAVVSEEVRA